MRAVDRHGRGDIRFKEAVGARLLERLLDAWDPARQFFLRADIREFERRRGGLGDALRNGELGFAFDLSHRFRERVEEYTAWAFAALDGGRDALPPAPVPLAEPRWRSWAPDRMMLLERWRLRVSRDVLALEGDGRGPAEVRATLRARYAAIREGARRRSADSIVERALDSYVAAVDRHGAYLSPRALNSLKLQARGALAGIGVILRSEGVHAVVDRIVSGGPAERSRALAIGDRIVGIARTGEPRLTELTGWTVADVVDRLRGPVGTSVRLRILPAGVDAPARTITLIRDKVGIESAVAKGRLVALRSSDCRESRIGIITVPSFYTGQAADPERPGVSGDVRRIVRTLRARGMDALLLDLRRNPGGSLDQAVRTAGLFIAEGPVVQVRSHGGAVRIPTDPDPRMEWAGALAVLVGPSTASGAEIVAAAMQDYRRGVVVGERTFGKGSAQAILPIDPTQGEGALRLTTSRWFRVTGETIETRGVYPDVDLVWAAGSTRRDDAERSAQGAQRRIPPARWETGALAGKLVVSLRARSRERLLAHPELLALRNEVAGQAQRGVRARAGPDAERGPNSGGYSAIRERLILAETSRITSDLAALWTANRQPRAGSRDGRGGKGVSVAGTNTEYLHSPSKTLKNCVVD